MPKPLTQEPPTSAVKNILLESAQRATTTAVAEPQCRSLPKPRQDSELRVLEMKPPPVSRSNDVQPAVVNKEYCLCDRHEQLVGRLTSATKQASGARVNASYTLRILLDSIAHVEPEILRELARVGPMQLPQKGDNVGREAFEQQIRPAIIAAFRLATPLDQQ